jgi:hypothetical protein
VRRLRMAYRLLEKHSGLALALLLLLPFLLPS